MTVRAFPVAVLLLMVPVCAAGAQPNRALREVSVVRTVSGSGAEGFQDGPHGSFLMPMGIARDAAGNVYVTDAGAQRIRRIASDGTIVTIAGGGELNESGTWVTGSYRDGLGARARFNRPAGIAVRRDGDIYVADTFNHCIRRITAQGLVSTYAGSPEEEAQVDGPRTLARFVKPTGLAVDADDNLYVADLSGIRKIDRGGNTTTLPSLGVKPYAVAVFNGPIGTTIFAGDRYGIVGRPPRVNDPSGDRRFASANAPQGTTILDTNGNRPLGNPAFLAALDENTVAYSDVRTNTIRLLEIVSGETKIVAGPPAEDASGNTGGYRDGPGNVARFLAPMGLARSGDGGLLVADGGNRRVRQLSRFDRVDPWDNLEDPYPGIGANPGKDEFRIIYAGNSYVWYDTYWDDSIEGLLQSNLYPCTSCAPQTRLRVIPAIRYSLAQIQALADVAVRTGFYRAVVLDLNWAMVETSFNPDMHVQLDQHPEVWKDGVTRALAGINAKLASAHIAFLVVSHPTPFEMSPVESAWFTFAYETKKNDHIRSDTAPVPQIGPALNEAVQKSGAPLVNVWPRFYAAERSAMRRPLFGGGDFHLTQYGRELIAAAVAARLKEMKPWAQASGQ
ncbi:MAG: hypothetical protein DLM50_08840 [Candidatus Meridianibacter frigidus]|nr:MAG: hypothetical protein DLM50_08840 [Candidatus Eremiobacteraeota bacterium]